MFANNFWFWFVIVLAIVAYMLYVLRQEHIAESEKLMLKWIAEEQKKPLYPPMNDSDWEKLRTVIEKGRRDFD